MIRIRNLRFSYAVSRSLGKQDEPGRSGLLASADGAFQLDIPQLDIQASEKVAIVGRSGCGKTTLLNILAGIQPVSSGEIIVSGTRLDQLSEGRRRRFRAEHIGFAFQEFELIEYLNLRDNIFLPFTLTPQLAAASTRHERLQRLLTATSLTDRSGHFPRQLSHGQRQRAALCRALITAPQLVLADEPTGSLDSVTADEVMQLLFEQIEHMSATLVMVTHDNATLHRFDRVIRLDGGQLDPSSART